MLLDGDDVLGGNGAGPWELVQVAEAQYQGLDNEPKEVDDYPFYMVMLVSRNARYKTRERMGMGRLAKVAWEMARPRLELIILT